MIAELFYIAFITVFIGLLVIGHALLFSAIFKLWRDDWAVGRLSIGEHGTGQIDTQNQPENRQVGPDFAESST